MIFPARGALVFWMFALLFLSGCKSATETGPAYSLAQACIALKTHEGDSYIVASDRGYQLAAVNPDQAESFYLRPSRLGAFLLYDREQKYFGLDLLRVKRFDSPSEKTEWHINRVEVKAGPRKLADTYTLVSYTDELRLSHRENRFFMPKADIATVTTQRSAFDLIPQPRERCAEFPEDALDAERNPSFYAAKDPAEPVKGFVDMHTHIAFPKSMGGVVMAGEVFHPYGIEHALKDCDHLHGPNGELDLLGKQTTPFAEHSPEGYPGFEHWPNRETTTHILTYYRWIERAYLSGLRIMVSHATGNQTFCQLMGVIHGSQMEGDCTPIDTVRLQTEYMWKIQDYIDAQHGGPGKGWFRIATSAAQAREIINNNKLAVVLGTEYGTLFDCRGRPGDCTDDYIDQELDKLYAMGVRSVYPMHRFDNAFGGAFHGSNTWMHLTSKMNTGHIDHITDLINPGKLLFKPIGGHFFDMEECPEGIGENPPPSMKHFLEEDFVAFTDLLRSVPRLGDLLVLGVDWVFLRKLEPVPDYAHLQGATAVCNARSLLAPGRHLINRIIDKGMILEVDHMSYNTLQDTMEILEQRGYPGVVSSHGLLKDQVKTAERIFRLGGLAVGFAGQPKSFTSDIQKFRDLMAPYSNPQGVGFGSDVQGVVGLFRGDDDFVPAYPFDSYDGTVTFTQPVIGNRALDFNAEGMAHYGLLPEWVDNFRQQTQAEGSDSFDILMNSAEAYLRMWERAEAAARE